MANNTKDHANSPEASPLAMPTFPAGKQLGLRHPPHLRDPVLSMSIAPIATTKPGLMSAVTGTHLSLSDPTAVVQNSDFAILDNCQTCTLALKFTKPINLATPQKVNVKLNTAGPVPTIELS
jgi:hypothetical protein